MRLHQWDVLRANKAPFAFGLEPRVPFLDKTFLELVMNIDPQEKMVRLSLQRRRPLGLNAVPRALQNMRRMMLSPLHVMAPNVLCSWP